MILSITDFEAKGDTNGEWSSVLHQLTIETRKYEGLSKKRISEKERTSIEILGLLRRASEIHPDVGVRNKFRRDAEGWERGERKTRKRILRPFKLFLQGGAILATAPLLMLGAIMYGTGKLIGGIGDMLTLGQLDRLVSDTILK